MASLIGLDPLLEPLARTASTAVLGGGKRVRPTFAYWGWQGAAGPFETPDALVPALAALELLHAFALVHDDVMDRSETRRGVDTAHRRLAKTHRAGGMRGDSVHFGDSGAILTGDLCLVWADQMIARCALPATVLSAARRVYDTMRVEAIAGQFLDVMSECATTWSVDQALRTARLKTASYTVTRPLLYGAALAGAAAGPATDALTRAYVSYGSAVGEAFQLRDDLLGMYGQPSVTGKPADDIALAKPTVLLQLARSMATDAQARRLARALRRGRHADVALVAAIVTDAGARGKVEQMISDRIDDAGQALRDAPVDSSVRAALTELASAAAWRLS